MCVHVGGQPRIYTRACVAFFFLRASERASARLTLTSCWQQFFGKVGARGRYSSPSVWPPPPGTQTQISRGTTCCGGKASAQTKPLNILSKSIKAPRDWRGLIVCVRYYRGLRGHHPRQKLGTALRKSWRRKKKNSHTAEPCVVTAEREASGGEVYLIRKTCCHFFSAVGVIDNLTAFPSH